MSEVRVWNADPTEAGTRLDLAITRRFPDLSRGQVQDLIADGSVTVNGRPAKPSYKVRVGDTFSLVCPTEAPPPTLEPTPPRCEILYLDESIVVINKPAGLVVHPGAGHEAETVVSSLLSQVTLSPIGAPLRPGIVQRLDKETSGVMVLARTREAHRELVAAFSSHRRVDKEYLAIVQGAPPATGRIEAPIERDRVHRQRMMVTVFDRGKPARTTFSVEERFPRAALVKVRIETGRTHQIRVHLASLRFPLLGDVLYGGRRLNEGTGHFLHSSRLSLEHPATGAVMTWTAPLPEAFARHIELLRGGT
jgi:23S rRNA pseudouridine1911/1915/1917 synthase